MQNKVFTDFYLKSLLPRSVQFEVFDAKTPNLGIRVSPGGTKSFVFYYRIGGRRRRLTFGKYPIVTLRDARAQAIDVQKSILLGNDPQAEKLKKRRSATELSFKNIIDEFVESHAKQHTRSWKETRRLLLRDFVADWGRFQLSSIDKALLNKRLVDIREHHGPSAANHSFAAIRKFFNWCVELDYIQHSPCNGLRMPAKVISRERVLQDQELAAVWLACERMGYPFGPFVQLLILTGQRRTEVSSLRRFDLDLGQAIWTQTRNKSNRTHDVPLSRQAVEIIRQLPYIHAELIFPARRTENPISGFSKWKRQLNQISKVEDWTLHDLRRTAATKMASLGVAIDVIELALNHQSQKLRGIAGIYNRFKYFDERKAAFQRLADHYQQLFQHLPMSEPQSTVIGLRGATGQWLHQEMPRCRFQ